MGRRVENLLSELSVGNGLSSKLDVEGVGPKEPRGVEHAHNAVTIVDDVNVDVTAGRAANVTRDVTFACLRRIDVYHTLLANRDCCPYAI